MERALLDAHARARALVFPPSAYVPLGRGAVAYESLFPLPRADEPALAYAERVHAAVAHVTYAGHEDAARKRSWLLALVQAAYTALGVRTTVHAPDFVWNVVREGLGAVDKSVRTDNGVWSVAWSPDGARLASADDDHTVRVWDAASGALLRTLAGHTNLVSSVAWSPDGTRLASASDDGTVRVWDTASGALLRTLTGHTNWVQSVAWSPDGARLASAGGARTVRVWHV